MKRVLESGCSELQEYRQHKRQNGENYRQSGDDQPNLVMPPRFEYICTSPYVLGLPKVLWSEVILKHLNVMTLFQLLRVNKVFYAIANAELHTVAKRRIGHERATPFALEMVLVIEGCPFNHLKARRLKMPCRLVRGKNAFELVRLAIDRHGYMDHLLYDAENMNRILQAEEEEEFFIMRKMSHRMKWVNDALEEKGHCFTISNAFDDTLDTAGDLSLIQELRRYVRMEQTRPMDTILADLKHPCIYLTLRTCSVANIRDKCAFAFLLDLLSQQSFSDAIIVDYTLSICELVQTTNVDAEGYCRWEAGTVTFIARPGMKPYYHHHSYHFTGP